MAMKRLVATVLFVTSIVFVTGATEVGLRAEQATAIDTKNLGTRLLTDMLTNQYVSNPTDELPTAAVSAETDPIDRVADDSKLGCHRSTDANTDDSPTEEVSRIDETDDEPPTIDIGGTTAKSPDPEPKIPPPRD